MKRLIPIIFAVAIMFGVFAPVTAVITAGQGVRVGVSSAYATADDDFKALGGGSGTGGSGGSSKTTSSNGTYDAKEEIGTCGVIIGTLGNCIEYILYYIPYTAGSFLMWVSAALFDSLAALTLSSTMYSGASFIVEGWRLTRDFANIFLILLLLLAALSFVLDIEIAHANPKKLLASVIVIALTINFSMFITELVIDSSNALALVFYNQIGASSQATGSLLTAGTVPPKSISASLVSAFSPQKLQTKDFWEGLRKPTRNYTGVNLGPVGGVLSSVAGTNAATVDNEIPLTTMIGILLVVGVMYFVVAWSLFIASLAFIGRLIGLWIAIIFAPLAFVSYIVPKTKHMGGFGWDHWWSDLLGMAFAAPIYFFFLLLISLMAQSSIVTSAFATGEKDSWTTLFIILVFFLMLITMLLKATKYVKSASGELAQSTVKLGSALFAGAGSLAFGAATGGIAFLGRRTLGARAMRYAEDEGNRDMASGRVTDATLGKLKSVYGLKDEDLEGKSHEDIKNMSEFQALQTDARRKVEAAQKTAARSFDFRQTIVGGTLRKETGMNMGSFGALSMKRAAGGYEGERNAKATKDDAFKKKLGYNHDQLNAYEDTIDDRDTDWDEANRALSAQKELIKKFKDKDKRGDEWKNANDKLAELQNEVSNLDKGFKKIPLGGEGYGVGDKVIIRDHKGKDTGATHTITQADIDAEKTTTSYFPEHIAQGVKKANGEPVDIVDVNSKATATHGLSRAKLNKMMERVKTDRVKSFDHIELAKKDFEMHGTLLDSNGNIIRTGHLDLNSKKGETKDYLAALKINAKDVKNATGVIDAIEKMTNVLRYGVVGAIKSTSVGIKNTILVGQEKIDASAANLAATGHAHKQGAPINKSYSVPNLSVSGHDNGHEGHEDHGHDAPHPTDH